MAIHGDSDTTVPLDANSREMQKRYEVLGGKMQLIVPPGQGHNMWSGFFQCQELVDFVRNHDRVYVVDQNRDAQLLALMRLEFDPDDIARLRSVRYYGGLPLDARTITDDIVRQEGL